MYEITCASVSFVRRYRIIFVANWNDIEANIFVRAIMCLKVKED